MDLKQLEAFVSVMETGSFSRAAELLHLTQPTVSAHVVALEQELRLTLITRTTRELYPTDAGRLLYEYAGRMLELRGEAREALRRFASEKKGVVTVAASTIPAQYLLPRLLQAFRRQYPEVTFRVESTDSRGAIARVVARTAEVGFCGMRPETAKCVCQEFADDRLVVVTPDIPRYRRFQRTGFPIRRLERETLVSREKGSGTRRETEAFLREMGVDFSKLRISREADSNEDIGELVAAGEGVAVLSWIASEHFRQSGRVLTFDFSTVKLRRKLYVLRRKNGILSPTAQAFYDFAAEFYRPRP